MNVNRRNLGNSGLKVGPLAIGGNVFGWTIDEATSFRLLDAFVAAGFNLIDTADIYSRWVPGNQGGESEIIIGRWLKQSGQRDKVVIATKVGMEMGPGEKGLSRAYILKAVEHSLRRLQTNYIDLYQSHQDDEKTPLEETLGAFAELIKQGKLRAIGASNYTAERLAHALKMSEDAGLPRYECLQPHYNLCERARFEPGLEPLCQQAGLGVIPYFSLIRSEPDLGQSPRGQAIKKFLDEKGIRILNALDQVAERCRSTQARVALAWLIARPSVTATIAIATNLEQLNDLIEGTRLQLDGAAVELLNKASEA